MTSPGTHNLIRDVKFALPVSALFSLALVWGRQLETQDYLTLSDPAALRDLVLILIVTAAALLLFWRLCDLGLKRTSGRNTTQKMVVAVEGGRAAERKRFLLTFAGLSLCGLIVLLGVYPGFFVYDAQDELMQVVTRNFSTHHPLLHVLLMGGTVTAVHKVTDSWNAGIFAYLLIQMLVISAVYTFVLQWLRNRGAGKVVRFLCFLLYGLFPPVVMYTLCSCKDGLFGASMLLITVLLWDIFTVERPSEKLGSRGYRAALILAASMMMLMRHNGFYAWLVFIPLALILLRKSWKRALVVLLLPVLVTVCLESGLTAALHADASEHQEMLTVPIQQLARTYELNPEAFTPADREILFSYIPKEDLHTYTPRISDIIKTKFDNAWYDNHKTDFWKLWLRTGLHNPGSYLNAWLLTSYGFWYPGAVINVYAGNTVFTFTYQDSSYFGYETEQPGSRQSLIPAIDGLYRKLSIERFQQEMPVIRYLFAPSVAFWLGALYVVTCLRNRKLRTLPALLPCLLTWLTVLLGPTYLVRYVYWLWLILPVYLLPQESEQDATQE